MNVVGSNVKKIREIKKLTQNELVAKCHLLNLNISRSTLAKIESKVRRVTDEEVFLLAQSLNVKIEELFE